MSSPDGRNPKTLWQSYAALPKRTRLYFGLVVGLTGGIGLAVADKLQDIFPAGHAGAEASGTQAPPRQKEKETQ